MPYFTVLYALHMTMTLCYPRRPAFLLLLLLLPPAARGATVDLSAVTAPMTRLSDALAPLDLRRVRVHLRAGDVGRCCFDHITTSYDDRGDPVVRFMLLLLLLLLLLLYRCRTSHRGL